MLLKSQHKINGDFFTSKNFVKFVNNIVDKEKSEYYFINRRKRLFWHSKSVSISCRIRDEDPLFRNKAPELSMNIRAFLLNYEKYFNKILNTVMNKIYSLDQEKIREYIYALYPGVDKKELDKKMGLLISSLPEGALDGVLQLDKIGSCRLLGYEKELFYLKCYNIGLLPVFVLRALYHTKYSHLKLRKSLENEGYENVDKGLKFELYLDKISFS